MFIIINYLQSVIDTCINYLQTLVETYGIYCLVFGIAILFDCLTTYIFNDYYGHHGRIVIDSAENKCAISGYIICLMLSTVFYGLFISMILPHSAIAAAFVCALMCWEVINSLYELNDMLYTYRNRYVICESND